MADDDVGSAGTRWLPALTKTLDDHSSRVSRFIRGRFPNHQGLRRRYRDEAPALIVQAGSGNPGTIGAALDWRLRFLVDPYPSLRLAALGAGRTGLPGLVTAVEVLAGDLQALVGADATPQGRSTGPPTPAVNTAAQIPPRDETRLLRACWALALLTEVYRSGRVFPGSQLANLDDAADAETLLALAPTSALDELAALTALARTRLLPVIRRRGVPLYVGPVFAGSRIMHADADMIAGGMLLEVKTALGHKRADGSRRCTLEPDTVYQSLGYVLLDFHDAYRIDAVAIYAARYGYVASWPLGELLSELAGQDTDLGQVREEFTALLLDELQHRLRASARTNSPRG